MRQIQANRGAAIRLERVRFSYGEAEMAFDLEIEASSITAVIGPSGSGKSTLLNLIAGFERPDEGRILIDGADVTGWPPAKRPVSMIFQENNLFAHLDVVANVGLGRSPSLRLTEADRSAMAEALASVGLAGKEKRLPRELSGGERQRVALARVLVRDRPILLLDEPFASLGPALRVEMLDLLHDLHERRGMTVLMVTHNPEDALRLAERTLLLEQGRIQAAGHTAELFSDDGPEALRRYIGIEQNVARIRRPARKPT